MQDTRSALDEVEEHEPIQSVDENTLGASPKILRNNPLLSALMTVHPALKYLGFSLLMAYHYLMWFCPSSFFKTDLLAASVTVAWLWNLVGTAFFMIVTVVFLGRKRHLSDYPWVMRVVTVLLIVATALLLYGAPITSSTYVIYIFSFVAGGLEGLMWILWGESLTRARANFSVVHIGTTFGATVLVVMIVSLFIPADLSPLFVVLLVAFSGVFLYAHKKVPATYPVLLPHDTVKPAYSSVLAVCSVGCFTGVACYYLVAIVPWEWFSIGEYIFEIGMEVTIVQRPQQLMKPFDPDMAAFIHAEARKHGIKLALGHTVEGFRETDDGVEMLLADTDSIPADMVVLAIGVTPDTHLAQEAGLAMGVRGSILVNDHMETSAPDVYAVGDAVQVKHLVTGEETLISLAGPANKQGRIAADNICGIPSTYRGSQGSSVIKVFDITAASTGVNETVAKASGLEADHVILSPMSHAGYYPGGKLMTMKVVFEKETYRLLGAQIVGYEGVDKRIDVLATAIFAGLRATELKDLDLAYAPPYSSAKDPVNMAGFMIENIEEGIVKQWYLGQLEELQEKGERGQVTLLDVRTPAEIAFGRIPGFMNIPLDSLRDHLDELDPAKPIYVICQSGLRSYVACRILAGYGFDAFNFAGGYRYFQTVVNDRALIEAAFPCGADQ